MFLCSDINEIKSYFFVWRNAFEKHKSIMYKNVNWVSNSEMRWLHTGFWMLSTYLNFWLFEHVKDFRIVKSIYITLIFLKLIQHREKKINTSYLTDSYIVFTLKMESVSKITIFGLKIMVKSGLEKIFLKFLHAQGHFQTSWFTT